MTDDLLRLSDWLSEADITHVAMESTGEYWKPIYNILEDAFDLLVVNASHIKNVPGRKTDVKDSQWIAELLEHGLLRASFVPPRPQRILRDLTRHRRNFVRERSNIANRIQKVLEGANIKLSCVATDILGVSGRAILEALAQGETDPETLSALCVGRLKDKSADMVRALSGCVQPHQRLILSELLFQVDALNQSIATLDAAIEAACSASGAPPSGETGEDAPPVPSDEPVPEPENLSFAAAVQLLDGIPGVGRIAAQAIVAEIGTDMRRFPSAGHLCAWAGVAPGNRESGGKRLPGRLRQGNPVLRQTLVQAAHAAAHTKDTSLSAQYHRLAPRRGAKRAAVAVAHSILVIAYNLLLRNEEYKEAGADYHDRARPLQTVIRLTRRIQRLGFGVTLEPPTTNPTHPTLEPA
jgi:transposase